MYTTARLKAGLSREDAANALHVGNRTLHDYEKGLTKMPPGTALTASRVYSKPDLTAHYCKRECEIGQEYCYNLEKKHVSSAAIQIVRTYQDLTPKHFSDLLKVAEDCRLTEDELKAVTEITLSLMQFEKAIEEWKLAVADVVDIPSLVKEVNNEKQTSRRQASRSVV